MGSHSTCLQWTCSTLKKHNKQCYVLVCFVLYIFVVVKNKEVLSGWMSKVADWQQYGSRNKLFISYYLLFDHFRHSTDYK